MSCEKCRQKIAIVHLHTRWDSAQYVVSVYMGSEGALSYYLRALKGSSSLSMNNLQLKKPLPGYREKTVSKTMARVNQALDSGVYSFSEAEIAPDLAWPGGR